VQAQSASIEHLGGHLGGNRLDGDLDLDVAALRLVVDRDRARDVGETGT
jgi:hypothetical protein